MPLKHGTETRLIALLACMIALAGAAVAFLPPLSVSVWPWIAAFIVSVLYPVALYPLFKENRADYEFRLLHFVPMLMLLAWLVFDLAASFRPSLQSLQEAFTWGWSLPIVAAAFALLLLFCLKVMRQRGSRIWMLVLLLAPFLLLSQLSERNEWDKDLAMMLWQDEETGSGLIAGGGNSSNLGPSADPAEERWRMQLRRMERRRQRLENGDAASSASSVRGAVDSAVIIASGIPDKPKVGSNSGMPHLPSSGFGVEGLVVTMLAGYCTALHRKSAMRNQKAIAA